MATSGPQSGAVGVAQRTEHLEEALGFIDHQPTAGLKISTKLQSLGPMIRKQHDQRHLITRHLALGATFNSLLYSFTKHLFFYCYLQLS